MKSPLVRIWRGGSVYHSARVYHSELAPCGAGRRFDDSELVSLRDARRSGLRPCANPACRHALEAEAS